MRALLAVSIALCAWPAAADQTIHVTYTEVPYRQPHAFLGLTFEGLGATSVAHGGPSVDGKQFGMGLRLMSARDSNFQFEFGLGLGKLDANALKVAGAESLFVFEMVLGARLFPRKPLIALGEVVIRPTISVSGGFNTVGGGANGVGILTAGLVFGISDDPNGLTAEFVYRPLGGDATFNTNGVLSSEDKITYGSSWGLRFGVLFGP
jgi:hypothetical protein